MKRLIFLFHIIFLSVSLNSQELPHPVANTGVYEFLDELASMQIIEINSAVKPYSRLYIANKLNEADQMREVLNPRQERELEFYLMDFGKERGSHLRQGYGGQRNGRMGDGARERGSEGAI